jgi:hypothetical protein
MRFAGLKSIIISIFNFNLKLVEVALNFVGKFLIAFSDELFTFALKEDARQKVFF